MGQHRVNNTNSRANIGLVPPQRQNVDINALPSIECKCGNNLFTMGMQLRYASRLVSQNGQPTVVQVPSGWICTNCGKPNDFAYKPELSEIIPKESDPDYAEFEEE